MVGFGSGVKRIGRFRIWIRPEHQNVHLLKSIFSPVFKDQVILTFSVKKALLLKKRFVCSLQLKKGVKNILHNKNV